MTSLYLSLLPPHASFHQPRRLDETCSASSLSVNGSSTGSSNFGGGCSKPIAECGSPPSLVSAPDRRIVAVGDLHGDLSQATRALQMANVLSSDGHYLWTGGETVLIQVGDVIDRGHDDIAILSLLRSLDIQARAQGGAVFQINGNHETMNVEGDFRHVGPGAFDESISFLKYLDDYGNDWEEAFLGWLGVSQRLKEGREMSLEYCGPWNQAKKQKGVVARSTLLRPGGQLACELARHAVVLKVEDWIFCHGGLLPHHVAYGVERMNEEVSHWMRGHCENPEGLNFPFMAIRGDESVVWNRLYSTDIPDMEDCHSEQCMSVATKSMCEQIGLILEETLVAAEAQAMVVGHTVQSEGVRCKYNGRVWCIDVGMSSGVLNSAPEVLEIRNNAARVIKGDTVHEIPVTDYT